MLNKDVGIDTRSLIFFKNLVQKNKFFNINKQLKTFNYWVKSTFLYVRSIKSISSK